jgi:hypothetical protein
LSSFPPFLFRSFILSPSLYVLSSLYVCLLFYLNFVPLPFPSVLIFPFPLFFVCSFIYFLHCYFFTESISLLLWFSFSYPFCHGTRPTSSVCSRSELILR